MYQLIVFLPLLGAIIAGAIAVFGAHQRYPGGEPGEHGEADHHAPVELHAHVAKENAGEDDDEDDSHAHVHAPAAVGSRPAEYITSGFLIIAALLSWVGFFLVG